MALALATASRAQEPTVVDLRIEGNRRLGEGYLRSRIETRPGETLDRARLQADVARLCEGGMLVQASFEEEAVPGGVRLVCRVEEAPWVRSWAVETDLRHHRRFRRLLREALFPREEGRPRRSQDGPLREPGLHDGMEEIRRFLRGKGYYHIRIDAERVVEGGEVDLTVHVGAQGRRPVGGITVLGEPAHEGRALRRIARARTKPRKPFTYGRFDPEVWAQDVRQMEGGLRRLGWLDAVVEALPPEVVRGRWLYLPLRVTRGTRYRLGQVEIRGDSFAPSALRGEMRMREGDWFEAERIEDAVQRLHAYYSDHGRFLEDVTILPRHDLERGISDVMLVMHEGEPFTVDEIEFVGNVFTRDRVLRREMRIRPGEPFHHAKVQESVRRLQVLRYFSDVRWELGPLEPGGRRDLIVQVEEDAASDAARLFRTGNFHFGGSYSEELGAQLQVNWQERNFALGRLLRWPYAKGDGQAASVSISPGSRYQSYRIGFLEPWFLDLPVGLDLDGFLTERELEDYRQGTRGASLAISRRWELPRRGESYRRAPMLSIGVDGRAERVHIHDVEGDAPSDVKEQRGTTRVHSLEPFVRLDGRDDPYTPTRGYYVSIGHEYAGDFLGGEDFWRTSATARLHVPLHEGRGGWHVLHLGTRAGWAEPHNRQDVLPVSERFFAGGASSIRGFQVRSVGPKQDGRPRGGGYLFVANQEYEFPIGRQSVLRGALFHDIGTVERVPEGNLWDEMRSAWGLGARVSVPVLGPVPLQFDWGFPIEREDGDRRDSFSFTLSGAF